MEKIKRQNKRCGGFRGWFLDQRRLDLLLVVIAVSVYLGIGLCIKLGILLIDLLQRLLGLF